MILNSIKVRATMKYKGKNKPFTSSEAKGLFFSSETGLILFAKTFFQFCQHISCHAVQIKFWLPAPFFTSARVIQ